MEPEFQEYPKEIDTPDGRKIVQNAEEEAQYAVSAKKLTKTLTLPDKK